MKKIFFILGIAVVSIQLCFAPSVSAKLYTWVDKTGVTRRTYYPPPPEQVMQEQQMQSVAPVSRRKADNKVELYVTSWCPYCKKALEYFRSKGVNVTVYDIEKDRNAAARKKKLDGSGGGVPFAVINGEHVSGYAPDRYSRALK